MTMVLVVGTGVRIARKCTKCKARKFADPDWKCEAHPGATVVQENRPYLGVPTPTFDPRKKGKRK